LSTKGIILINTGTPASTSQQAIRAYLKRFLSDKRVVNLPAIIWQPVLNCIVLPRRPKKTAEHYRHIWTEQGSPFVLYSREIERRLKALIYERHKDTNSEPPLLRIAYRYSNPDIQTTLNFFRNHEVSELTVLPLYPQQAFATTMSVSDEIRRSQTALNWYPKLRFIESYHLQDDYIQAVANTIKQALFNFQNRCITPKSAPSDATTCSAVDDNGANANNTNVNGANAMALLDINKIDASKTRLIFSFHSTPIKDRNNGDLYFKQTQQTSAAIAQSIGLPDELWQVCYQSRFNDAQKWIGPFLDDELKRLLFKGVRNFFVITPGFAVDCLESLYEVKYLACHDLLKAAQAANVNQTDINFHYIPALNATDEHIQLLANLVL
jgi:ferrochelatase